MHEQEINYNNVNKNNVLLNYKVEMTSNSFVPFLGANTF